MAIEVITSGVQLVETDERHDYTLEGAPIPGCTSIIKGCRMSNIERVPEAILRPASIYGTKVHEYAHWLDQGELDLNDLEEWPDYQNSVRGWQQFREDFEFESFLAEQPIAIRVNGMVFGVKPDRFGEGKLGPRGSRKVGTVELKTTALIEPCHHIQTAAQALALKERDPLPARLVCQLLEKPLTSGKCYRVAESKDPQDERIFLAALAIDYWKRNNL